MNSTIKISKLDKISKIDIKYELENDDFIVDELLALDEASNFKEWRKIGYYFDINWNKNDILIYWWNVNWLVIKLNCDWFYNEKILKIDSIDLEEIKHTVSYLIDRYKKYIAWENIEPIKKENDPVEEKEKKEEDIFKKIDDVKSEILKLKFIPSKIKPDSVDEDKWALWIKKLDTIYLEVEIKLIDLDKNMIKIWFTDTSIEDDITILNSIDNNWKIDLNLFMKSVKLEIWNLVRSIIMY